MFYSGSEYVPDIIRSISLLFDISVFFFCTGCLIIEHKNIDPIKQMLKLVTIFACIFIFFQLILGPHSIRMFGPLILQSGYIKLLPALQGSYWFVPVYVI